MKRIHPLWGRASPGFSAAELWRRESRGPRRFHAQSRRCHCQSQSCPMRSPPTRRAGRCEQPLSPSISISGLRTEDGDLFLSPVQASHRLRHDLRRRPGHREEMARSSTIRWLRKSSIPRGRVAAAQSAIGGAAMGGLRAAGREPHGASAAFPSRTSSCGITREDYGAENAAGRFRERPPRPSGGWSTRGSSSSRNRIRNLSRRRIKFVHAAGAGQCDLLQGPVGPLQFVKAQTRTRPSISAPPSG